MPADLAQEIDVVELRQPLGVVRHDGVGLALAEPDEMGEGLFDARLVGLDRLDGQKLAALVLAGRIADPGRAAAHQSDRLAAGLLQPVQHHDRHERADMQRRRGAVEADVGDEIARARLVVEALKVRALVDIAALLHHAQEVGSGLKRVGHAGGSFGQNMRRGLGNGMAKRNLLLPFDD